jgi:hypothetical protein
MAVIGNSVTAGIRATGSAQLESKCMGPQILSQFQGSWGDVKLLV